MTTQTRSKEKKIVFVSKISRVGTNKQLVIYILKGVRELVDFGKTYKITLEKI